MLEDCFCTRVLTVLSGHGRCMRVCKPHGREQLAWRVARMKSSSTFMGQHLAAIHGPPQRQPVPNTPARRLSLRWRLIRLPG
eukprot:353015-Chlamydomonas_euryale.AAC.1